MDFKEAMNAYKEKVDQELNNLFENMRFRDQFLTLNYSFLKEYVKEGKRLRPILMIMAYKAFRDDGRIIPLSLSLELLHNSTLVHDDIMDEDDFRRNNPAVHKMIRDYYLKNNLDQRYDGPLFGKISSKFAVSNAIIGGNILYELGSECILNSDFSDELKNKALAIYNRSYRTVNHGQYMDIFLEKKEKVTEKDYFEMSEKKTAELFSAAVEIGATLAESKEDDIKKFKEYAKELAVAFQLVDDIMDISKGMSKGHALGSDIIAGKKTLLVLKALEVCSLKERKELLDALGSEDADIDRVIEIIERNSLEYVRDIADKKIETAKKMLSQVKLKKESKDFFLDFADFMVRRKK